MGEVDCCHFLDGSSVPGVAFAGALSRFVPTTAWLPKLSWMGSFGHGPSPDAVGNPLSIKRFPLQRGYHHASVDRLLGISAGLEHQLIDGCKTPSKCLLICTSPYWAAVAEKWPGPVVYYSLDLTGGYHGVSPERILNLDTRLCRIATMVSPVSQRIADYLVKKAGCDPIRITIIPNATLSDNLQAERAVLPGPRPADIQNLTGPIAGVIGNMAENLDWILICDAMANTQEMSWVFVGPAEATIVDRAQRQARNAVMKNKQGHFLGARPYKELQSYARSFDVAVLPYRRREPTYSGSATRFYEHLAAGRPMIGTRNVFELLGKEPFLVLVENAAGLTAEIDRLRKLGFRDGLERARIRASQSETWDARALLMMNSLGKLRVRQEVTGSSADQSVIRP